MARIRTIKPEFFTSLTMADLSLTARLTFIGLWTHCDDEGRCVADARLIRAAIWPLDDRSVEDIVGDLGALTESSLITQYEVGGRSYIQVNGWGEHQKINRPTPSKLPSPKGTPTSKNAPHGGLSEDSLPERKGKEQGTGKGEEPSSAKNAPTPTPPRPDVDRICNRLADRIEANGSKRPAVTAKWRETARLMLDRDGRTEAQVLAAIDWCQDSTFWRGNVLSMPKLREKYDQLRLAAQSDRSRSPAVVNGSPRPSTTDQRVAAGLALVQKFADEEGT